MLMLKYGKGSQLQCVLGTPHTVERKHPTQMHELPLGNKFGLAIKEHSGIAA